MAETGKVKSEGYPMRVDPEFKEVCDAFELKIKDYGWGAIENIGYRAITKAIARKMKEMKIV